MLEGAAEAERRGALRRLRPQRMALELDLAGGERQHAGDQVERGALARAVGADQPDDAAALTSKLTSLTATSPPNALRALCACSSGVPGGGSATSGSCWLPRGTRRRRWRRRPNRIGHNPLEANLQDQHQHRAEGDGFEIAGIADQPGQEVLQLVVQNRNSGGAENGAVNAAGAAEHRHQQIFGAGVDAEWAGIDRALEMRIQPAGQAGEHRGIDEDDELGRGGVDAEGFGGTA